MGGITGHYGAWRNVAGDDTACSDNGSFADGHSWKYGYIAPEPDIVPYGDGQGFLGTLVALLSVEGMDGGEQAAARTDEDVAADCDRGLVENGQVEVDVGVIAYGYMGAVVAEEGGEDGDPASHVAYERAQESVAGISVSGMQPVELIYLVAAGVQFGKQFGVGCGIVPFAAEHFLLLSHNFVFIVG